MLKMRLQRVGRKHEPAFRLVLTDSKNSTKSGKFKEILGSYDPRKTTEVFNVERIKRWLSLGALPTDTVHNLLVSHKIIEGKKRNVLPKKTPPQVATPEAPAAEVAESPAPAVEAEAEAEAPTPAEVPTETESAPEEAPAATTPEAPSEPTVEESDKIEETA